LRNEEPFLNCRWHEIKLPAFGLPDGELCQSENESRSLEWKLSKAIRIQTRSALLLLELPSSFFASNNSSLLWTEKAKVKPRHSEATRVRSLAETSGQDSRN